MASGFGDALRAYRVAAELTQEQLAERAGLSVRGIRDLERGRVARPRRETVRLLAGALGIDESAREALLASAGRPASSGAEVAEVAVPEFASSPEAAVDTGEREGPVVSGGLYRPWWRRRFAGLVGIAVLAMAGTSVALAFGPAVRSTSGDPKGDPGSAYVGRVAADAQVVYSSGTVVHTHRPVKAGDAVVVAMMLTSTTQAPVSVSDSAGDEYTMVADVFDAYRHRALIFAAFAVKALPSASQVTLTWPRSSKYHVAVEEFSGVSAARGRAAGSGLYADHRRQPVAVGMSTGCSVGDLVVAAVGSNSGPAPLLGEGWRPLPEMKLSSYRLTVAYRHADGPNDCALTGSSQSQWEVALVSLGSPGNR